VGIPSSPFLLHPLSFNNLRVDNMNKNGTDDLDPKQKKAESKRLKKAKADVEQEVEIYWKQFNDGPKLAIGRK
jgi:hypothetical protein